MSAARKPTARPRRLVLVRGGLDGSHTGGGDGDWEDFCRRIGWQTPAPEPDDDFERRLQEGLLAIPRMPDNAIEIEGAPGGLSLSRSNSGVRLRPWLEEAEELGLEYEQYSLLEYEHSGVRAALDVDGAAEADFGVEGAVEQPCDLRQSFPSDVRQSLPSDVRQSFPCDVRQSLPSDVRQSFPSDVRQSLPSDVRQSFPCDVRQSFLRDVGQSLPSDVGQSLPYRSWARVGVAAAALAVAAAAALAVTRLATSPAGSKAASITAPSSEMAQQTAPHAPDERDTEGRSLDAPAPRETGPVRATSAPAPTTAPGPTSPRVEPSTRPDTKPEPPGIRVARLSLDDGTLDGTPIEGRGVEGRDIRQSLPSDVRQSLPSDVRQSLPSDVRQSLPSDVRQSLRRDVRQTLARDVRHEDGLARWESPGRDGFELPAGEPPPVMASLDIGARPGAGTVADPAAMRAAAVRSLVAQPMAGPAQRAAVSPARDVRQTLPREPLPEVALAAVENGAATAIGEFDSDAWARVPAVPRPAAPEDAQAANGSWSLAGAKDRWVGASLAAPPPPLATSNVGVIVQLDLGKAFGKL